MIGRHKAYLGVCSNILAGIGLLTRFIMDNNDMLKNIPPVISSQEIYKNPWLRVREDKFIDSLGKELTYGIVEIRDGVVIVALDIQKQIYLVREYRPAIGKYSLEIVNGGIEKDETTLVAAQRELAEEAHIHARYWTDLGYVESGTAIVKCRMDIFLAEEIEEIPNAYYDLQTGIEVLRVPFTTALEYVNNGIIVHAPSIVALFKVQRLLQL